MTVSKLTDSMEALVTALDAERKRGSKIVLCHGTFDPLHPGHILHLQAARQLGDVLVVTVTSDQFVNKGPWRPIFSEHLRAQMLAAIECVDHVLINNSPTAVEAIKHLRPDVYAKGSEYADASSDVTGQIVNEEAAVSEVGGRIEFTHEETFSASSLVNQVFSPYPPSAEDYLNLLRKRHSAGEIIDRLKALSTVKPLVIGEAIIDEYCYAEPLAKAPRESIIASQYRSLESFAGGAVATANHLAGFCKEVTLVVSMGDDPIHRDTVETRLASNVTMVPIITNDRSTVIKRRFLDPSHLTKMFEIQFFQEGDITSETEAYAASVLTDLLPTHDLAIVNDFGHGFLTEELRALIADKAPYLALNTQTNSANLGFNLITRYPSADYCCIDLPEAQLASGMQHSLAADAAQPLIRTLGSDSFMVTTGKAGSVHVQSDGSLINSAALSPTVVDRVGSGDAFFALTAPWVYKYGPDELAGFIGNCAGALQVGVVGNRAPIRSAPLYKFIASLLT